jgi:predicted branched-subunit amino acid permease
LLSRHAKVIDERLRAIRLSTVAVVWLFGLAAGLYSVLAAAARFGCMSGDRAVACQTSGLVLLVTVVAIVIVVTVMTGRRPARPVLIIGGTGVGALAICWIAAWSLLSTA